MKQSFLLWLFFGCICNFSCCGWAFSTGTSQAFVKHTTRTTSKVVKYPSSNRDTIFQENSNRLAPRQSSTAMHALPPTLPWIVAHVVSGASGSPIVISATRREDGWYRQIPLPSFTPPDRIFAPVWATLYGLMGFAFGRIYLLSKETACTRTSAIALGTWAVHMLLNLSWAPIFFGLQRLRLGLMINYALLLTLVGVILPTFYQLNPLSAYLLLPYLAWLSFATALNFAICRLNPTMEGYNNAKFQAQLTRLQRHAAEYSGL
jgi:benzodiazapine receptor